MPKLVKKKSSHRSHKKLPRHKSKTNVPIVVSRPINGSVESSHQSEMKVIKRDGTLETVSFDKITSRIKNLSKDLLHTNPTLVAQKTIQGLKDRIKTSELDELAASICTDLVSLHPDYEELAARIIVSNHHKNTLPCFSDVMALLYHNKDINGVHAPLINKPFYEVTQQYSTELDAMIEYDRDYYFSYFGFKTLANGKYLLRVGDEIVERPQHLIMRVAVALHKSDLNRVQETYDLMSNFYFTHATPTLFNAGTVLQQLASCFPAGTLVDTQRGSIEIEKVEIGDITTSHLHHQVKVTQVHRNPLGNRKLYKLNTFTSSITVTDNHELWVVPAGQRKARWIQVKDLNPGDYIGTKRSMYNYNWESIDVYIKHHINIDGIVFSKLCDKHLIFPQPDEDTPVWTLGVDQDHSYTVHGLMVRNCFLLDIDSDSIDGMYKTLMDCAKISKTAGGIGVAFHKIRANGSRIRSTNGTSTGIRKILKVYNATANHVDQGGNKRNGSFAIYLEPWHADIFTFIELRRPDGNEELRARQLFYALWIPDLFMERVEKNQPWSLMCPDQCPGLDECYGLEFNKLYKKYEMEGKFIRQVKARELWKEIIITQIKTGMPYMLYKDQCNRVSPQKHLGTIKSSNLCVSGDTLVLTRNGQKRIETLYGQTVDVWNGYQYSNVKISQTGVNQPMLRIGFSNESSIECTHYHKFFIHSSDKIIQNYDISNLKGYLRLGIVKRVDAKDLKQGDELIGWKWPGNINVTICQQQSCYYPGHYMASVVSIESSSFADKVYCFKEPILGTAMFNGVLTSNCSEIIEYTSTKDQSVCNLLSISLPAFVEYVDGDREQPRFNFENLEYVTKVTVRNENKVIDLTYYPTTETKTTNLRDRPIGIGVQGYANALIKMRIPFDSSDAKELNRKIFECIYYSALCASMKLSKRDGPYQSYQKSELCLSGKLHCDYYSDVKFSPELNWKKLREKIAKYGVRNSLLIALMPTASTSQILGNTESFEPYTSNFYVRRTKSGDFIVANKYLIDDLVQLDLWNNDMRDKIIANNGSIQTIDEIPDHIKELYKTSWDISQKVVIDLAADRSPFIDQSQSMNLYLAEPSIAQVGSMHMYAWKKKLKTGMYYLRSRPAANAEQVTVDPKYSKNKILESSEKELGSILGEGCISCSG